MSKYILPLFKQLRSLLTLESIDSAFVLSMQKNLEAWIHELLPTKYYDADKLIALLKKSLEKSKQHNCPLDVIAAKFLSILLEDSFEDYDAISSKHFLTLSGLCHIVLQERYQKLETKIKLMQADKSTVQLKKLILQFIQLQHDHFEKLADTYTFKEFNPVYQAHQQCVRDFSLLYCKELTSQKKLNPKQNFSTWEQLEKLFQLSTVNISNHYYKKLLQFYQFNASYLQRGLRFFYDSAAFIGDKISPLTDILIKKTEF